MYVFFIKGEVRTLAGGTEGFKNGIGKQARFFHPTGLTFDNKRKIIYVTDQVSFSCIACLQVVSLAAVFLDVKTAARETSLQEITVFVSAAFACRHNDKL